MCANVFRLVSRHYATLLWLTT